MSRETPNKTQERELEKRKREQRITNAMHRVFSTEDGQLVMEHLSEQFGLTERVFAPISKGEHFAYDPLTAALSDGARGVLIYIRKRLSRKAAGDANIERPTTEVIK